MLVLAPAVNHTWKLKCRTSSQPLKSDNSKFANQRHDQNCQTLENLASSMTSHCQFGFDWICWFGFGLVGLNPDLIWGKNLALDLIWIRIWPSPRGFDLNLPGSGFAHHWEGYYFPSGLIEIHHFPMRPDCIRLNSLANSKAILIHNSLSQPASKGLHIIPLNLY